MLFSLNKYEATKNGNVLNYIFYKAWLTKETTHFVQHQQLKIFVTELQHTEQFIPQMENQSVSVA